MRQYPATQFWLKAAGQEECAVVEAALDPRVMAVHELRGLGLVAGKFKQYDKHYDGPFNSPLERFRAKWIPLRVKKTRQNNKLEPRL
jgi:hypothetical protein